VHPANRRHRARDLDASRSEVDPSTTPVGGRIVAEVFVGILDKDRLSYQSVDPSWKPELASPQGTFGMADLIRLTIA
jgi:hypothetical protein